MTAADLPLIRALAGDAARRGMVGRSAPNNTSWSAATQDEPDMDQFIVSTGPDALSVIFSATTISKWNAGFGQQPEGTRGIDQFIGEPDMIGRGHGSAIHPLLRR